MRPKKDQFRIFKSDAAPFFFYIDVIPLDLSLYDIPQHVDILKSLQYNPIMPIPLRVDRVYNGEPSILIRPRENVSFPLGDKEVYINPTSFIRQGIEKLIYLTEVRGSKEFTYSLTEYNVIKWWNSTKYLYGRLKILEEDFSASLKAYIHTMVKAKLEADDLISAANQYCELIKDICNKRIQENQILVEKKEKEKFTDLYKMKDGKVVEKRFKRVDRKLLYPSFVDIEVMNFEGIGFSNINDKVMKIKSTIMKYIPLLFYDDLLECMLQNLETLKEYEGDIIDPSILIENNIIKLIDIESGVSKPEEYTWLNEFEDIKISEIMNSFEPTFPYDLR